jgi:hypothetical protein
VHVHAHVDVAVEISVVARPPLTPSLMAADRDGRDGVGDVWPRARDASERPTQPTGPNPHAIPAICSVALTSSHPRRSGPQVLDCDLPCCAFVGLRSWCPGAPGRPSRPLPHACRMPFRLQPVGRRRAQACSLQPTLAFISLVYRTYSVSWSLSRYIFALTLHTAFSYRNVTTNLHLGPRSSHVLGSTV